MISRLNYRGPIKYTLFVWKTYYSSEKYPNGIVGEWRWKMEVEEWPGFEETEEEFQGLILSTSWSKKSLQNFKLTQSSSPLSISFLFASLHCEDWYSHLNMRESMFFPIWQRRNQSPVLVRFDKSCNYFACHFGHNGYIFIWLWSIMV